MSPVMLQFFHWYLPNDGTLWNDLARRAPELAQAGFTAVWLPPASKGHVGGYDVGYGVYDMYDLGEFEQKGSLRTKYGTKDEYLNAIRVARASGLAVFADIVWNHRLGADAAQTVTATPYSSHFRGHPAGEPREVRVWTKFEFTARGGKYDSHTLDARHFTAVDYDEWSPGDYDTIYLFAGKHFDQAVSGDFGNYAYLMGCDLDHANPEVRLLLTDWAKWLLDLTGIDGLRLDAVKHLPEWALASYVADLRAHVRRELPVVGEYWSEDLGALNSFLAGTGEAMMLFDVPLHYNFFRASHAGNNFDLRRIFDNTLAATRPDLAVTFVENHDSQPLQALESPVEQWFKPLAYALILLRRSGFPCVFYGDYFGVRYTDQRWEQPAVDIALDELKPFIDVCLMLRMALGDDAQQEDVFDHPNVVGWVRRAEKLLVIVLMSNGDAGRKHFHLGVPGVIFREATGATADHIVTDGDGTAEFECPGGGVAIWVALL